MTPSFEIIYSQLGMDESTQLNDEQMLLIIADRVAFLLESDIDLLLSYLYRLDIDEEKIEIALLPGNPDPAHIAIGKLILSRQKARAQFKRTYKVEPLDEEWEN